MVNVKFSASQLNKSKSETRNAINVTLGLSSDVIGEGH